MKMKDLKELDSVRLRGRAQELEGELAALREAVHFGKEKNHAQVAGLKRDVARAKTALAMRRKKTL